MWILSAVYSVFAPFIENIWNIVHFNSAYYGAMSSLERAQLVLKYRQAGFEWSWWFFWTNSFGPKSDSLSWKFGLLTNNNNGLSWNISSRTLSIPQSWQWNIEYLLTAWTDSSNYNKLPYFLSEKIILSYDNISNVNRYYTWTVDSDINHFSWGFFSWIIRVPPKAKSIFGNNPICFGKDTPACDQNKDWIFDDILVNRNLEGNYLGTPFSIIPTVSVFYFSWVFINEPEDNIIRESIIDQTWNIYFWDPDKKFSPLADQNNNLSGHNVISSQDIMTGIWFDSLLTSNTSWLKLWLSLVNLVHTQNENIYPFLEYKFWFPQPVADKFFTIQWAATVGNYNIKIVVRKPVDKDSSSLGDFTIIF